MKSMTTYFNRITFFDIYITHCHLLYTTDFYENEVISHA